MFSRRSLLGIASGFLLARSLGTRAAWAGEQAFVTLEDPVPFAEEVLLAKVKDLAQQPFVPPPVTVSDAYKHLTYDQYRAIRFKRQAALWGGDGLKFEAEFFHTGYIYPSAIDMFMVADGKAARVRYRPDMFTFGPDVAPPEPSASPGFSGFRLLTPVNRPDLMDEFAVFQGASYFRAKATKQDYGLSARGLALNTARPPADEFPVFRAFWLVKPEPSATAVTVYGLLDSVSTCGLYKFVISAVHNTVMEIDATLFPRKILSYPGIAPLTSMFYFAPSDRYFADEVRERVHDSDGLLICNGKGEQIWRPLRNPPRIQFSTFLDRGPRGFGLVQRERRPERFQDFDARYEDRPSAWVEPLDDWGEGSVDLVELPTANEYADNIVAYWRPKEDMGPGRSYRFRYRLTWTNGLSPTPGIATVFQTLVGASTMHPQMRLFYIDFQGTETFELCDWSSENCGDKLQNLELNASAGSIVNVALRKNPIAGGHRLGFEFDPPTDRIEADLRCALVLDKKPISEVWIYRWTR